MGKATGGTTETKTGQSTNSTNTVNTGPWAPQQPYLEEAFGQAKLGYDNNKNTGYYPGQTVAPINDVQNDALWRIGNTADQGNTVVPAANDLATSVLRGDYLNSNPYIDKTFGMASDAVKRQYMTGTAPQTAGAMAAAGRYGSGDYRNLVSGNEQNYGKTLDDLATSIYGGNYANERGIQTQTMGMAPALASARYIDPLMKMQAGDIRQQQTQREDDAAKAQFDFNRDAGTRALNTYLGQIQGNYGQNGTTTSQGTMTGTQQTPYYSNPAASGLGGILGLSSLFSGGSNSAASGIGSLFGKGGGGGLGGGSGMTF